MTWDNYDELTLGEIDVLREIVKARTPSGPSTPLADGLTAVPH